jgi:hypothetical protein
LKVDQPLSGDLSLEYSDADGVGTEADLDFYLYNEDAEFGNADDMIAMSGHDPDSNPATPETETIHLQNLAPGKYLINVLVHTESRVGGPVNFQIKLNGSNLCPAQL